MLPGDSSRAQSEFVGVAKPLKKCPFCREPIAAEAVRCKHCQADLTGSAAPETPSPTFSRFNTFRVGFLAGLLFAAILAVIAYLHFSQTP